MVLTSLKKLARPTSPDMLGAHSIVETLLGMSPKGLAMTSAKRSVAMLGSPRVLVIDLPPLTRGVTEVSRGKIEEPTKKKAAQGKPMKELIKEKAERLVAEQSEMGEDGVRQPSVRKPETEKLGIEEPGMEKTSTEKPSTKELDIEKPGTKKPGTGKEGVRQPSAGRPEMGKLGTEKRKVGEPSTEVPTIIQ